MNANNLGLAIINKTVVPIRKRPENTSSLLDEGLFGMVVKLIKSEEKGWHLIETLYDYRGYVHENDLLIDIDRALNWEKEANYLIVHSIVDIMKEPNYKNYKIQLVTKGASIKITGNKKDDWIEVMLPTYEKGWLKKGYIEKKQDYDTGKDEKVLRERLVKTACEYIGTQYRWGGKSPLGIDCSGLCSITYLINGITIWRDSELRKKYMREIKRKEMKKGDLLYYKGHVAMYIGNGKVVHSSSSRSGVSINSLNEGDDDYVEELDREIIAIGTIF